LQALVKLAGAAKPGADVALPQPTPEMVKAKVARSA